MKRFVKSDSLLYPVEYMQLLKSAEKVLQTSYLPLAVTQPQQKNPGFISHAQIDWCHAAVLPPVALTKLAPPLLPNQGPSQLSQLLCSVSIGGTGKCRRKQTVPIFLSFVLHGGPSGTGTEVSPAQWVLTFISSDTNVQNCQGKST